MGSNEHDDLLAEVVRRGRFRDKETALKTALEAYNDARPWVLDGSEEPSQRAKLAGKHLSRRAAETAALRAYLETLT